MNNIKITILMFAITFVGFAQVGIGTTSPDASSALDITATDKGFLMPRMTTAQRTAIASPAMGLQVFDTDTKSVWINDGTLWKENSGGGKFVDGISPDIAYYDGKVRIGTNTSGPHKLNVESRKSDDAHNRGISTNVVYEGTGTSESTYGVTSKASNTSTGTIDFAIGVRSTVANGASGTINFADGLRTEIENSGTIGVTFGEIIKIINSGTIGTGVGKFIDYTGGGTINNSYALYITSNFNKGTNSNYSLYSESDADSYFAGDVGFGNDNPQQKVHISGAMRLEPQAAAPAGGALGDLYVGTDSKLYFHNGTAWKEVQLVP